MAGSTCSCICLIGQVYILAPSTFCLWGSLSQTSALALYVAEWEIACKHCLIWESGSMVLPSPCTPSYVCYPIPSLFPSYSLCVFNWLKLLNFVCESFCSVTSGIACLTTYYEVICGKQSCKQSTNMMSFHISFFSLISPLPFNIEPQSCLWKEDWHKTNPDNTYLAALM